MAKALPYIAAAATFVVAGFNPQAAQIAFTITSLAVGSATKPKRTTQERQASAINLSIGEVPRTYVFGTARAGATLMDAYPA